MRVGLESNSLTLMDVDWHEEGDQITVDHRQNVQPVMEYNEGQRQQLQDRGYRRHRRSTPDPRTVARIPFVVWQDLMRRGITQDHKALMRWIDDSDNRCFKLYPGKVSR